MPWRIDLRKSRFHWENINCRQWLHEISICRSPLVLSCCWKEALRVFHCGLFSTIRGHTRGFWNKKQKPCIPRKETCRQTDGPPPESIGTGVEGSWPWGQCTSPPPLSPSGSWSSKRGTPGWVCPCTCPLPPIPPSWKEAGVRSKREPNKYPQFIMGENTFESAN